MYYVTVDAKAKAKASNSEFCFNDVAIISILTTVCFKIQDTSPIVSLLFWLNSDLLNLWEKSGLIVIAISLQEFQR